MNVDVARGEDHRQRDVEDVRVPGVPVSLTRTRYAAEERGA